MDKINAAKVREFAKELDMNLLGVNDADINGVINGVYQSNPKLTGDDLEVAIVDALEKHINGKAKPVTTTPAVGATKAPEASQAIAVVTTAKEASGPSVAVVVPKRTVALDLFELAAGVFSFRPTNKNGENIGGTVSVASRRDIAKSHKLSPKNDKDQIDNIVVDAQIAAAQSARGFIAGMDPNMGLVRAGSREDKYGVPTVTFAFKKVNKKQGQVSIEDVAKAWGISKDEAIAKILKAQTQAAVNV